MSIAIPKATVLDTRLLKIDDDENFWIRQKKLYFDFWKVPVDFFLENYPPIVVEFNRKLKHFPPSARVSKMQQTLSPKRECHVARLCSQKWSKSFALFVFTTYLITIKWHPTICGLKIDVESVLLGTFPWPLSISIKVRRSDKICQICRDLPKTQLSHFTEKLRKRFRTCFYVRRLPSPPSPVEVIKCDKFLL